MGKNNEQLLAIAKKYLGKGGSTFRKYCGLPSNAAWCNAFVCYIFNEGGDASLYYGGKKVTYCPTSIRWCQANLAQIPIYLALPMDVIYFDWELNGVPNHIGFVRERKSDQEVYTIEGNTSGGIVAQKTRVAKYVCGCYRPHFKPTGFDANKKLTVDGYFGYNSIAVMQRWLKNCGCYTGAIDAILGKGTIKALQKKVGEETNTNLACDGSWGVKTTKALQKLVGTTVDGAWGTNSTKAFQTYLNKKVFPQQTIIDKEMDACKAQSTWMKNATYTWESKPTIEKSKKKGTCVTYVACVLQRIGVLKSGEYIWQTGKGYGTGKVYGNNSKMTVTYMNNKTISSLKSQLKVGDIVMLDDNKSGNQGGGGHIFILAGWSGTTPLVWDNETAKKGQKARTYSGSRKVLAVVRLK